MEGRPCTVVAIMIGALSAELEQHYGRYMSFFGCASPERVSMLLVFAVLLMSRGELCEIKRKTDGACIWRFSSLLKQLKTALSPWTTPT